MLPYVGFKFWFLINHVVINFQIQVFAENTVQYDENSPNSRQNAVGDLLLAEENASW